jgi:hypothetical protein
MRIESGLLSLLKGEVGDVRREWSLSRYGFGKRVVLGGQRVLSLSTTSARITGGGLEGEDEVFCDG